MGTKFVIRPDGVTKAIYADKDRDLLDKLGVHTERRASHIDPLDVPAWYLWLNPLLWGHLIAQYRAFKRFGKGHFAVYWRGEVSRWFPVFNDEMGRPFRTKEEAEIFEVARLERDYFGTRRAGALLLEALITEREKANGDNGVVKAEGAAGNNVTTSAESTVSSA